MGAPTLIEVNDPFAAVRALGRMRTAGVVVELDGPDLVVSPANRLSDVQRAFIRAHKPALAALLMDAATVYSALERAGTVGLAWHEGTPADWPDARLLAADEVLYGDGRMVTRNDRRYATVATVAVAKSPQGQTAPPAKVSPGDTATAYCWWLVHYPDRDPVEVACCPEATHAEILERYPDAVAAEPFTPTIRQPSAP